PAYLPCLPSFPTRRSSDLSALHVVPSRSSSIIAAYACFAADACRQLPKPCPQPVFVRVVAPRRLFHFERRFQHAPANRTIRNLRSEEHTSELQSRENLVCR